MTPDEARILALIRDMEARTARLEKAVKALGKSTPTTTVVETNTYRTTLKASANDPTLHDDFVLPPHASKDDQTLWTDTTNEVMDARKRHAIAHVYANLSQRLEAMENLIQSPNFPVSDNIGNSLEAGSLEFVGATVSGSPPNAVITISGAGLSHTHVWNEIPSGLVDGSNTDFSLAYTPKTSDSVLLAVNGIVQKYGQDYNVTGVNITVLDAPHNGDTVWVWYII